MATRKTKIEFEYEGRLITLEYTADSLRKMQERGFDVRQADAKILTLAEDLFCGAFIANHDDIKLSKRREIFKELCGEPENPEADASDDDEETGLKGRIEGVVVQMFKEACEELASHRGNLKWRIAR